jgi:hypothetical protein
MIVVPGGWHLSDASHFPVKQELPTHFVHESLHTPRTHSAELLLPPAPVVDVAPVSKMTLPPQPAPKSSAKAAQRLRRETPCDRRIEREHIRSDYEWLRLETSRGFS